MTTDPEVRQVANVFLENDVLWVPAGVRPLGFQLAGAAWLITGARPQEAHLQSLGHAVPLVITRLADYEAWLLACHSAWQPDTRVTRHRKLWRSLEARGLVTPSGRQVREGLVESVDGLRFFGALQLGLGSLEPVAAILEEECASHLVALRRQDESVAAALVGSGWARPGVGPSPEVLEAVCSVGGVVFWPIGRFDDRDAGCIALAKPEVIDRVLR